MYSKKLKLAPDKTEAVLLNCRRKPPDVQFNVMGTLVTPKEAVKYLGVWIGRNINFKRHITECAIKAEKTISALSSVMPNIGGPSTMKRKILSTVGHSVILYGAPIWAKAMDTISLRNKLLSLQRRMAIRVACAYRTVATDSILAISGLPPIHLLIQERRQIFKGKTKEESRNLMLEKWQSEWSGSKSWSTYLIKDIRKWFGRKHGALNYYLTQFLTGHGSFRKYLCERERSRDDECLYCGEKDDAEHTIIYCPRWNRERQTAEEKLHIKLSTENIIDTMLEDEEKWIQINTFISAVLKAKSKEEEN